MKRVWAVLSGAFLMSALVFPAAAFAAPRDADRAPTHMAGPSGRDFDHHGFGHGFGFRGFYGPFWQGFGWAPYGYGYWGPGYYGFHNRDYGYYDAGGLKLKIQGPDPKRAEVYANGAYVGTVDDFNGFFQQLTLRPGPYSIDVRAQGYQPLTFKVRIQPDKTITYHAQMQRAEKGA
jgi:hypothetical protein